MDVLNQYYVLAGLLPDEVEDDLDAELIEGLRYLAGDVDVDAEIPPQGNVVIHPPQGNLVINPAADNDDEPQNPWKLFGPRRIPRNPNRLPEPDLPTPTERVCQLEYLWTPKVGSLRSIRKWAQVRKSGVYGTKDGLASIIY